jgi:hypothetical protein
MEGSARRVERMLEPWSHILIGDRFMGRGKAYNQAGTTNNSSRSHFEELFEE